MAFSAETPRFDAPKTVLQTVGPSPTTIEIPQSLALRFYPNGLIDLEPDNGKFSDNSHMRGSEYQDIAMKSVDASLPEGSVALGSHLLDASILGTDLAAIGRPDVMVFVNGVLDGLYEFKRSWHSEYAKFERKHLVRKLERISALLEILRTDPMYLGELIRLATGQDILQNPPSIPADKKLKPVVFVSSSPWNRKTLTSKTTALRGSFWNVPAQT
ncbi:MAG: hypothetical protein US51_C0002G0013 [Microgenomates group bacterium GW2011_GWA2_37_6]|nr:MAG: hypothetical protein US51_C0002G0013 [Microgenomates group bacterium GW2011_GWA2_37_6]